jgi:Lipopolysaccharide kinase (Kdo/WaaP) family
MEKIHRENWEWHCLDPHQLDEWFSDREQLAALNEVKANPVRKVFTVDDSYFVKQENVSRFSAKIKNKISNKAKREFDAAIKLAAADVPCVRYLGWGYCKTECMLFTETFKDAISADDYYWDVLFYKPEKREEFLIILTDFLKRFFNAGFDHPDLHLGNLLLNPETMKLKLVDVYGVHHKHIGARKRGQRIGPILSSLRDWLDTRRAAKIILELGVASSPVKAQQTWINILKKDAKRINKSYAKRLKQLINGKSKHLFPSSDDICFYRRSVKPIDYEAVISEPEKFLTRYSCPAFDAAALLQLSLHLRMHHLNHLQSIVNHEKEVFFDIEPTNTSIPSEANINYFNLGCRLANLPAQKADNLFYYKGMVFIRDIRGLIP